MDDVYLSLRCCKLGLSWRSLVGPNIDVDVDVAVPGSATSWPAPSSLWTMAVMIT
jgi:hypothetical protein